MNCFNIGGFILLQVLYWHSVFELVPAKPIVGSALFAATGIRPTFMNC